MITGHVGPGNRCTGGRRCAACRKEHREAEKNRIRQIAYGRWNPWVDAEPVRAHVRMLAAYGMGLKRVQKLTGLSNSTLSKLMYGIEGRPPTRRVRTQTAEKILALQPRLEDLFPSALVDATGTRRRIQALAAAGWTLNRIALQLGWSRWKVTGVLHRYERVTAASALQVRELYDRLWDQPCPARNAQERDGIRRAVAHARRMGWAPPMAWDDNDLDDPRARPKGLRRGGAA